MMKVIYNEAQGVISLRNVVAYTVSSVMLQYSYSTIAQYQLPVFSWSLNRRRHLTKQSNLWITGSLDPWMALKRKFFFPAWDLSQS
jgi:hypothetical protein